MKPLVICLLALSLLAGNTYSQVPTGTPSLVDNGTSNTNQNQPAALKEPGAEGTSLKLLSQGLDEVSRRLTITTADDQFKILIFGSLVGETISSTQRITSPGTYLFVNPFLGRDSPGST